MRQAIIAVIAVTTATFLTAGRAPLQAQEKVTFASTDGDLRGGVPTTLAGYLYKPDGNGPFPGVVGIHGCDGLTDEKGQIRPLYGQWGELLSAQGYMVLLQDSMGSRGQGNLCAFQPPSERPVQANRELPRDAYGALAYLRSRSDVRGDRIAVMGQSFGGQAVLFTIAGDALPRNMTQEQDFRAAIVFYPFCQPILNREPAWSPREPMLLLMGEVDNFTPAAPCKELLSREQAGSGPPVEAHFYANTYHAFDHPNMPLRVANSVKLPPDGHSPTLGTNSDSRADAIARVKQFLAKELR